MHQEQFHKAMVDSSIQLSHAKQWCEPMTADDCAKYMVSQIESIEEAERKAHQWRGMFNVSNPGEPDGVVGYRLRNALTPIDGLLVLGKLRTRKGSQIKYPRPINSGFDVWAPDIEPVLGRTWQEVISSGEPILLCEGYKKCMAAVSALKIPAIGLPSTWFEKDKTNTRQSLVPRGLWPFIQQEREITICFDTDRKAETNQHTRRGLMNGANELCWPRQDLLGNNYRCSIRIATLPLLEGASKTGLDDYIHCKGAESVHEVLAAAEPYHLLKLRQEQADERAKYTPTYKVNEPWFGDHPTQFGIGGVIGIRMNKGSGKTSGTFHKLAAEEETPKIIMVCPLKRLRVSAQRQARDAQIELLQFASDENDVLKLGLDNIQSGKVERQWVMCPESLHLVSMEMMQDATLIIDEARQLTNQIQMSSTFKEGKRHTTLKRLRQIVPCTNRIILLDADLDDWTFEYWLDLKKEDNTRLFVPSTRKKKLGFDFQMLNHLENVQEACTYATQLAISGYKLMICCDSLEHVSTMKEAIKRQAPHVRMLEVSSNTSKSKDALRFFNNPRAEMQTLDVVLASPSMKTGVSIEDCHFHLVVMICTGSVYSDSEAAQAMWRVRNTETPRLIWAPFSTGSRQKHSIHSSYDPEIVYKHIQNHVLTRSSAFEEYGFDPMMDGISGEKLAGLLEVPTRRHAHEIATRNRSISDLRMYIQYRLILEGCLLKDNIAESYPIKTTEPISIDQYGDLQKEIKAKKWAIAGIPRISQDAYKELISRDRSTEEERTQVRVCMVCNFFGMTDEGDTLSLEDVDFFRAHYHHAHFVISLASLDRAYWRWMRSIDKEGDPEFMLTIQENVLETVTAMKDLGIHQTIIQALDGYIFLDDTHMENVTLLLNASKPATTWFRQQARVKRGKKLKKVDILKAYRALLNKAGIAVKATNRKLNKKIAKQPAIQPTRRLMEGVNRVLQARIQLPLDLFELYPKSATASTAENHSSTVNSSDRHGSKITPSSPMNSDVKLDRINPTEHPESGQPVDQADVLKGNVESPTNGAPIEWQPEIVAPLDPKTGLVWIRWPELGTENQLEFLKLARSVLQGTPIRRQLNGPTRHLNGRWDSEPIGVFTSEAPTQLISVDDLLLGLSIHRMERLKELVDRDILLDF